MKSTNVLIPTYNRADALTLTLTSLSFQEDKDFDIIISDQSPQDHLLKNPYVQNALRILETRGHGIDIHRNLPSRGMAHQRQFLLEHSSSRFSLFLDDDLILEPFVIKNMRKTLEKENCGFVGSAVIGLSFKSDFRPDEQHIEFWEGNVEPETVYPNTIEWQRYKLHNAANIWHIERIHQAHAALPLKYKVAWVGGCTMYFTDKLKEIGGFTFWKDLPEKHCGEDVLAQLRVMRKYGGCGIIPSGVYHQELETTVTERKVNAPEYLEI
ncbi:MAG TPA: glycosyltransferase family A protein [Cytophagales bacterium]|nr:glycosyltransferase family A protein [Cytophagales bacterium]